MASLNIKNEEAFRLAHEVGSTERRISVTLAVTIALKERLPTAQAKSQGGIGKEADGDSSRDGALDERWTDVKELMDELYDPETGLPA